MCQYMRIEQKGEKVEFYAKTVIFCNQWTSVGKKMCRESFDQFQEIIKNNNTKKENNKRK